MTTETIHTCSYSCQRIECIRAQRDELRGRLEALAAEGVQAGEVEFDRVLDANALAPAALRAFNAVLAPSLQVSDLLAYRLAMTEAIASALSQQPEARGVVDEDEVFRLAEGSHYGTEPNSYWDMDRDALLAFARALTGERNG